MTKLDKQFFLQPTLLVAKQLIGKDIVFKTYENEYKGIITETEAYFGNDPASHAFKGLTKRNAPMFEEGGIAYIYMIYGIYYCLNFVTEQKNNPAAVLIRGVNIFKDNQEIILNGPGKLCKYLEIDKNYNNKSLLDDSFITVYNNKSIVKIKATTRIGITQNKDMPWRFLLDKTT